MTKQELARIRNWQKARLIGFNITSHIHNCFSEEEKVELLKIKDAIDNLLNNWDLGTKAVGLKPRNTKKCCICWMKRVCPDGHMCRECEKAMIESGGDVLDEKQKKTLLLL